MNIFRSRLHEIYTEGVNKIALSYEDDKGIVQDNNIDTFAWDYFDEYNIPRLKCKLLGHQLENLYNVLYELGETHLDGTICSHYRRCDNPGMEPPSVGLTTKQKHISIDINCKIRRVLAHFPLLNFLEHALDIYFEKIEKTLKLVVKRHIRIYGNVTVGRYMKELGKLRREREGQSIISNASKKLERSLKSTTISDLSVNR